MMYSEFVKGTGCKETAHNYKVFERLEAMYMNTDMTKEEIYEYGKKLVDNSKTPEEIAFENEIKADIEKAKNDIEYYANEAKRCEEWAREATDLNGKAFWKEDTKRYKKWASEARQGLKYLKSLIA